MHALIALLIAFRGRGFKGDERGVFDARDSRARDDLRGGARPSILRSCQRLVPFCSMKVRASITVRKPPREPSILVSAFE